MTYEYKGMLPLEEQRVAITKLIEELAKTVGSSVESLEFEESTEPVVYIVYEDEDDEDGTEVEIEGSEAPHFDRVKMTLGNYENIEWFTDDVENTYDEYVERLRMEYRVMHLTDLRYYERWHDEDMNGFSELGKWEIDD